MIDFTGVIVALIGGLFGILGLVVTAVVNNRMKDKQAAIVLNNALANALGAMQQAASGVVMQLHPSVTLPPSLPPGIGVGLSYVLTHAGEEAARFGLTQEAIADKLIARVGVVAIETNIATAASPAPTPRPLDPILPPRAAAN